jgi:hypothetical protein
MSDELLKAQDVDVEAITELEEIVDGDDGRAERCRNPRN